MIEGHGFTYRGIHFPNVMVMNRQKKYWAPRSNEAVEVRGRPGALFRRQNIQPLSIPLKVLLDGEAGVPFDQTAQEFADWLNATEPQPLVFDADPLQRTYFAILDGDVDPQDVVQYSIIELNFICYDPHAYGTEQFANLTNGSLITVRGSAGAVPITEVTLNAPTTFVAVSDGDQINMVGTPTDGEEVPYVREERKMWDQMGTTTGWGATTVSDYGAISGTIQSSGGAASPAGFGTASPSWHGPALKKSIGESIQDFRIEVEMEMRADKLDVGAAQVMLLGPSNEIVGSINLWKPRNWENWVHIQARMGSRSVGSHTTLDGRNLFHSVDSQYQWPSYNGRFVIERVGRYWIFNGIRYTAERGWHQEIKENRTDRAEAFNTPVAQVQISFHKAGSNPVPNMGISDIKIYKINSRPASIPYIGGAGDVFLFDHVDGTITKNGLSIENKKAFIGSYFDIPKGSVQMAAEPAESIARATVRWRDRWI